MYRSLDHSKKNGVIDSSFPWLHWGGGIDTPHGAAGGRYWLSNKTAWFVLYQFGGPGAYREFSTPPNCQKSPGQADAVFWGIC